MAGLLLAQTRFAMYFSVHNTPVGIPATNNVGKGLGILNSTVVPCKKRKALISPTFPALNLSQHLSLSVTDFFIG